jgi:hypothetical protein
MTTTQIIMVVAIVAIIAILGIRIRSGPRVTHIERKPPPERKDLD